MYVNVGLRGMNPSSLTFELSIIAMSKGTHVNLCKNKERAKVALLSSYDY